MLIAELYHDALRQLQVAGIESAESECVLLIEYVFGLSRSQMILAGDHEVGTEQHQRFRQALARRLKREPLAYITGRREFWSLEFEVSPAVLIPRQETEFLLDHILTLFKSLHFNSGGTVLDMCTGSGVLAIILARELKPASTVAVDLSREALKVARRNIARHAANKAIHLVCSDLFSALRPRQCFEIIVANPPYIADKTIQTLEPEVSGWEPGLALAAGAQGLDVIKRIALDAPDFLQPGGWLFLEIGAEQGDAVLNLFANRQKKGLLYTNVAIVPDWSGRARVLQAQLNR